MPDTARPPSILSEHGEGYCRYCRFVVGLNEQGLLVEHRRGLSMVDKWNSEQDVKACPGSYRRPPKLTPYASRKSAFRAVPLQVVCHACGKETGIDIYTRGAPTYKNHSVGRKICPASFTPVQP